MSVSLDRVFALVLAVASPTSATELPAHTAALQSLYTIPGFYDKLHQISADRTGHVPREARLMASLIAKNEMVTKWRAKTFISPDDKQSIRDRLFTFLEEPDTAIIQTQFLIMAKISRIDYPATWPNLFNQLVSTLISSAEARFSQRDAASVQRNQLLLRNILWALNRVIKEWSEVRIPIGTKTMQQLVTQISPVAPNLLTSLLALPPDLDRPDDADCARMCFKVLSRLSVWEWSRPATSQLPDTISRLQAIFTLGASNFSHLSDLRSSLLSHLKSLPPSSLSPGSRQLFLCLTKHVNEHLKFFRRLQEGHPKNFSELNGSVELVLGLWNVVKVGVTRHEKEGDQEIALYPTKHLIASMVIFKEILPLWAASRPDVLHANFVTECFNVLVEEVMPLSSSDLETIEDDPEEWIIQEETETAWTFDLRACGERLLMALNVAARKLEGLMESLLQQRLMSSMSEPVRDQNALLKKEAVYCALGRLVRSFLSSPNVEIHQLLSALAIEANSHEPSHRILKRRIAWLVGEIVDAEEELATSPVPWQLLIGLLGDKSASSDIAVRCTSARSLKLCMDLWELDVNVFRGYVNVIIDGLINLLNDVQYLTSKRRILETMEVLIQRVGDDILIHMERIAALVPAQWEQAASLEGEMLFKSSILEIITKLLQACKSNSAHLLPLVMTLLGESLQGPAKAYLEEDALILWESALRSAGSLDPKMLSVFPAIISQLSDNLEGRSHCCTIINSYMLLDAPTIYANFGADLINAYVLTLRIVTPDGVVELVNSLSIHAQLVPLTTLAPLFCSSGLLDLLYITISKDTKTSSAVLSAAIELFARLILSDANSFLEMLHVGANVVGKSLEGYLNPFLDVWWTMFDRISKPAVRKMVALATANLCTTGNSVVLQRFSGEFLNLWLDCLGELKEQFDQGTAEEPEALRLLWRRDFEDLDHGEFEGLPEQQRKKNLQNVDPVFTQPLASFIRDRLSQTPNLSSFADIGDPAFSQLQRYLSG